MIPLSQQCGIAEWCVNTISFGDYLVGKDLNPGAHQKYRPDDMTPLEARRIIKVCTNSNYNVYLLLIKCTYIFIIINNNIYFISKLIIVYIVISREWLY